MTKERKIQIYNAIRLTPDRLSFFRVPLAPGTSNI